MVVQLIYWCSKRDITYREALVSRIWLLVIWYWFTVCWSWLNEDNVTAAITVDEGKGSLGALRKELATRIRYQDRGRDELACRSRVTSLSVDVVGRGRQQRSVDDSDRVAGLWRGSPWWGRQSRHECSDRRCELLSNPEGWWAFAGQLQAGRGSQRRERTVVGVRWGWRSRCSAQQQHGGERWPVLQDRSKEVSGRERCSQTTLTCRRKRQSGKEGDRDDREDVERRTSVEEERIL